MNIKELEIETMEVDCQLVCHHETEELAVGPALWGGANLTTSAVWGGRISDWESPVTSEDSPGLLAKAIWGGTNQ
jgi:hypothetical protein